MGRESGKSSMHTDVACLICYLCHSLKDCCKSCGGVPNFSFHPALKNRLGRHGRLRVTHFQRLNHLKVRQPDGYPLQLGLILFQSPSSKCSWVSSKLPEKVYSLEAAHTFLMYSGKKIYISRRWGSAEAFQENFYATKASSLFPGDFSDKIRWAITIICEYAYTPDYIIKKRFIINGFPMKWISCFNHVFN